MATLKIRENKALYTPAQIVKAKKDLEIIRALIEQYTKAGDHSLANVCTDVLEGLHEEIERVEGPCIDPDSFVC